MNRIGYIGIAISLCIAGYLNASLLFFIIIKRRFYILSSLFFIAFVKIILATIFMLLALFILNSLFLNINLDGRKNHKNPIFTSKINVFLEC